MKRKQTIGLGYVKNLRETVIQFDALHSAKYCCTGFEKP